MAGLDLLMNIGKSALKNNQYSVNVTAQNIANVQTPGYSRQNAVQEAADSIKISGLVFGQGVETDQIERYADEVIERRLMQHKADLAYAEEMESNMQSLEMFFNEGADGNISDKISSYGNSWETLANTPAGTAERVGLYEESLTLADAFYELNSELTTLKNDLVIALSNGVDEVNLLTTEIAQINDQLLGMETNYITANDLRDKRGLLLTELSEYIDVQTFEQENGYISVTTAKGAILVNGADNYNLEIAIDSDTGQGRVMWETSSGSLADITSGVSTGKIAAWLTMRDEMIDGTTYKITERSLADLRSEGVPTETLDLLMTLKNYKYLGETDFVAALEIALGEDVTETYQDQILKYSIDSEGYQSQLDGITKDFIWSVNKQHSQGVGLKLFQHDMVITGTYTTDDTKTLGSLDYGKAYDETASSVGYLNYDGSFNIHIGDANGENLKSYTIQLPDTTGGAGTPTDISITESSTLTNLVERINTQITAAGGSGVEAQISVSGDTIEFLSTGATENSFGFSNDTSNILAALGINTFFTGSTAERIDVNEIIADDQDFIAAAVLRDIGDVSYNVGVPSQTTSTQTTGTVNAVNAYAGSDNAIYTLKVTSPGLQDENNVTFQWSKSDDQGLTWTAWTDLTLTPAGQGDIESGVTVLINAGNYQQDETFTIKADDWAADKVFNVDQTTGSLRSYGIYSGDDTPTYEIEIVSDGSDGYLDRDNVTFKWSKDGGSQSGIISGSESVVIDNDITITFNAGNYRVGEKFEIQIEEGGIISPGDNENAIAVSDAIFPVQEDYHTMLVSIGAKSATITRDKDIKQASTDQIQEIRDNISGVSIDEEFANLIKFQRSYQAAAKIISTADEMLETVTSMV
ncbi:flagellar hook-associated protein 1 FlgK [Candidatus Magnetomoraceae bacterium gMMP-1]